MWLACLRCWFAQEDGDDDEYDQHGDDEDNDNNGDEYDDGNDNK